MKDIFSNIQDPSWWFTGIFFILFGILLSKVVNQWAPSFLRYLSIKAPYIARGWQRKILLNKLKIIKSIRFNDDLVMEEILKKHTYYMIFIFFSFITMAGFFTMSVAFNFNEQAILDNYRLEVYVFIALVTLPTYVFEYAYFKQNKIVEKLIDCRKRITKRSRAREHYERAKNS